MFLLSFGQSAFAASCFTDSLEVSMAKPVIVDFRNDHIYSSEAVSSADLLSKYPQVTSALVQLKTIAVLNSNNYSLTNLDAGVLGNAVMMSGILPYNHYYNPRRDKKLIPDDSAAWDSIKVIDLNGNSSTYQGGVWLVKDSKNIALQFEVRVLTVDFQEGVSLSDSFIVDTKGQLMKKPLSCLEQ